MRKIYIVLTLLITFFVGCISAKAELKCVYKYSGKELVIVDGQYKSLSGSNATIKNISDSNGNLKTECPSKLIGFSLKKSSGSDEYYLYNASSFKNDQLYKNKKQEASSTTQISFDENVVFEISSNISIKCTYTDGSATLVTLGGKSQSSLNTYDTDHNLLKKLVDDTGDLNWKCLDEIKGFYVLYPNGGGRTYYLYSSGNYKNTDEYKNAIEREKTTSERVYDTTLIRTENKAPSSRTDISHDLKCTYSNGTEQIIIENGELTLNPPSNVTFTKSADFISNLTYCKDNIYVVSYAGDPGSVYSTYTVYVTDAYTSDSHYTGSVEKYTYIKGGKSGDNPDGNNTYSKAGTVSCGKGTIKNIPSRLIKIINTLVKIILIGVPVLLIIFGMIDFAKGVIAGKDDEIKKGQKTFISRLVTAILVFLVILIVKMAVRFINESNDSSKIISCIDCFINGDCE